MNVTGWSQLDELLDYKIVGAEETNQVSMPKMELHGRIIGPLETVHAELRPQQAIGGRSFLVGYAQHQERAVAQEHQLPARSEETGCLGDPPVGVGPDRRSVLADDEIKNGGAQWDHFTGGADEREPQRELILELPSDAQLPGSGIDTNGIGALARQPRGNVGRTAAELDGTRAFEVRW